MHHCPTGWLPDRLTCRSVTSQVSEFLDQRLPCLTELKLWIHLMGCPGCRAYAAQLRLLRHTLRRIPQLARSLSTRLRLRQEFLHRHGRFS
jgi:hypothetical protein